MEETYRQLFDDYFYKLYSYALTIVKDEEEAKDIVQSAFIKLWKKRADVDMISSARSYIYTTVYHLALNSLRNKSIRDVHHQQLAKTSFVDASLAMEGKEVYSRVMKEIEDLPPRCREAFKMSRFEGKKYSQIAEELGISTKTVEIQIGKALKVLREQLADVLMISIIYLLVK